MGRVRGTLINKYFELNKYFEVKTRGAAAPTRNSCSLCSLLCYQCIVAIATNFV